MPDESYHLGQSGCSLLLSCDFWVLIIWPGICNPYYCQLLYFYRQFTEGQPWLNKEKRHLAALCTCKKQCNKKVPMEGLGHQLRCRPPSPCWVHLATSSDLYAQFASRIWSSPGNWRPATTFFAQIVCGHSLRNIRMGRFSARSAKQNALRKTSPKP